MKKILALALVAVMLLSLSAVSVAEGKTSYKIGICNFVDDASLNQIVENIRKELDEYAAANGVSFDIKYDNCNADFGLLNQIISDFDKAVSTILFHIKS